MKKDYNEDGLKRDLMKLRDTRKIYKAVMRPHFKRFWRRPTTHNGTNLCVESCRAQPYYFGHVVMMYVCINTVAWIAVWIAVAAWLLF